MTKSTLSLFLLLSLTPLSHALGQPEPRDLAAEPYFEDMMASVFADRPEPDWPVEILGRADWDFNADRKNEVIVWWQDIIAGNRVESRLSGMFIYDIENGRVLANLITEDSVTNKRPWLDPETGEAEYMDFDNCAREVEFSEGRFHFGKLVDGVTGDEKPAGTACESIVSLPPGVYRFDGNEFVAE